MSEKNGNVTSETVCIFLPLLLNDKTMRDYGEIIVVEKIT